MPNYDYLCPHCENVEEIFHSMSDDSPRLCSECGKEMTKQISGGGGIIFKGTGFYHTDYKNKKKPMSEVTDRQERQERRDTEIKRLKKKCPKTMF